MDYRPLTKTECEPYLNELAAWLAARSSGTPKDLLKEVKNAHLEQGFVSQARISILSEERETVDKNSRKAPDLPPEQVITKAELEKELPAPEEFRTQKLTYLLSDTLEEEQCAECDGKGIFDCDLCEGAGKKTCPACGGSGDCPECHGSKTIECKSCGGRGSDPCTHCNGKGWIKEGMEKIRCPKCINGRNVCDHCGGRGKLECEKCFGRGNCTECKGSGKLKCEACDGRGIRVCDACGGEGKWKTYTLLQRSFTARQFDCFDRGDEMPPHIQASASAALHNARFDFDNSFRVGMTPDLRAIEEPIRSFAKRAFEELRTYVCEETDHMYRFTIRSVPVTTIFFTFDGRHYSGYFVGDDKAFFCDEAPDPVQHQHQSTLNRAQLSLDEGDPKGAYATLMKTMEHAVAVPQISREYRKLLCAAMEEARKAFETSGFTLALVLAIVLPTWLSFTGHVFGTAASLAAVVMPVLISRVLGTRICLCPPRAGLLISVVGVLLASGLSWLMSPLYAFPLGLAAVALTGAIGTFYIFTRLTTVSPIESNILRLCMRGEERS